MPRPKKDILVEEDNYDLTGCMTSSFFLIFSSRVPLLVLVTGHRIFELRMHIS